MSMNLATCAFGCALSLLVAGCSKQPETTSPNQSDATTAGASIMHKCLGSMFPIHKANNGERGEPYCIDATLISHDSYCLRSGLDGIHVRGAASRDAFKTFPNERGDRTAARLGPPEYSSVCQLSEQPDVWTDGDLLRVEDSGPDLKMSIADPNERERWSISLEPDPSGGHFYFSGTRGEFIYFVMLTDYNLGHMGPSSPVGVQAIAHGYRVEIYKNDWSDQCAEHRPDYPQGYAVNAKNDPPPNFHALTSGDSCKPAPKMHKMQPVSGGGGHDFP